MYESTIRSERSDSERPSEAASPPLMRQSPKHQLGKHERRNVRLTPVGRASPKVTPSPSKCHRLPTGTNNRWESRTWRIGVTAVWHRPQNSEISDGPSENSVLVNASQPLTTVAGLNAFPLRGRVWLQT